MIKAQEINTKYKVSSQGSQVSSLRTVLRGEISAVEAYQMMMDNIENDSEIHRVKEFLKDHQTAVNFWQRQVSDERVEPDISSGPWGILVETFMGSAKLFGNVAAMKAIKEDEEHGLHKYRELLKDKNLSIDQKGYIRNVLIPSQKRHIDSIRSMMKLH